MTVEKQPDNTPEPAPQTTPPPEPADDTNLNLMPGFGCIGE